MVRFILLLTLLSACCKSEKINLSGKWVQEGKAVLPGMCGNQNTHSEITFEDNGHYSQKIYNSDLILTFNGVYFINKNRNSIICTLVPDIVLTENDSIRRECQNWEIENLSDKKLIIVLPSEFVSINGKVSVVNRKLTFLKLQL